MARATVISTKSFKWKTILAIVFGLLAANSANSFDEELRDYLDYEEQEQAEQNQLEDDRSEEFLDKEKELKSYGDSYQQQNGFCAGKKDGNYINPNNPHSFYQCHQNGITQLTHCPPKTVYDPYPRDRCEWPQLVQGCNGPYGNCYDKQPIIVLPTPSPSVKDKPCSDLPQCPSCKPATVPAYKPRGKRVDPRGFSEDLRNFKQIRAAETEHESRYFEQPEKWSRFCVGKKDGNYINPNNPHSFYQCHQNGATVFQPCPSGTVYDPLPRDRCEWPNEVQGCNGGYGRGCKYAPIVVMERYPSYPTRKVKPSFPQCNVECKVGMTRPPVKETYMQRSIHQPFQQYISAPFNKILHKSVLLN
ncbi:uncharacterized protein LOC130698063 [Daphnia carinata]|uniref:uncharacterized protein LOC130698063 n=1 Tax=Daphnia carinata TaxID=120202 RepID=UPI00257B7053|nr:uncharacterized protein LOC130698063 [Daphnia carinata]